MINAFSSMMTDAYPLAGTLLIISASLFAILYMVSKFVNSRKLNSWIANEVFQALATATLLFLAAGLFSVASDLTGVFFEELAAQNNLQYVNSLIQSFQTVNGNAESHILFARAYLLTRLDKLNSWYNLLFYTYAPSSVIGESGAFFPEQGKIAFGLGSLSTLANAIQPLMEYIYYGFLFVYFQLGFLELIKAYFFYGFPAGIVFRSFPFTRSLGSFLIASALGLYFVYPFFLSLLLISNHDAVLNVGESDIINIAKNEYPSEFTSYYIQQKLLHKEVVPQSSSSSPSSFTTDLASPLQFLLLTMILYPFISFVAAYTFIHQFSALMQANVADLGRGLLKLI